MEPRGRLNFWLNIFLQKFARFVTFCNFDPDALFLLDTSDKEEPGDPANTASCRSIGILLLCPGI